MQDLYTENYKTLSIDIKEDFNKLKDTPCSQIRRHNIIKMAILPKFSTDLTQSLPASLQKQSDPRICKEMQKTQNSQNNLEKVERSWKICFLTTKFTTKLQ